MKVVFFGSGGAYSNAALRAFTRRVEVAAFVVPEPPAPGLRGVMLRLFASWLGREFRKTGRSHGAKLLRVRQFDEGACRALSELDADLFCVAAFPLILNSDVRGIASHGVLNAHPSLLPKHRGVDPIFWTLFHDEPRTGVTVHWMDDGVDSGDIVLQSEVDVVRGASVREIHERLGGVAGELLADAIQAIERGEGKRAPQDHAAATHDPVPPRGGLAIDWNTWPAERLWHFLRGAGWARLRDARGNLVNAAEAESFVVASHAERPGTFSGGRMYCRDGWVMLGRPTLRRRVARLLFRSRPGK